MSHDLSDRRSARDGVNPCPLPFARGLSRAEAACYIGVSPSMFDKMVSDGRMPKPKRVSTRTVWDRLAVDRAFDRLPGGDESDDTEFWDMQ